MSDLIKLSLLEDILESIKIIENRFIEVSSSEEFLKDDKGLEKLDSISMRLQIIGEELKKIYKEDKTIFNSYTGIEWNKIMRLRDIISHHYSDIDSELIFEICKDKIPELKISVRKIIEDIKKNKKV